MLAGMHHEMASAPYIAEWIADARKEALNGEQKIAVTEFEREFINRTCLSSDFVRRQVQARVRSNSSGANFAQAETGRIFYPPLKAS